MRDNFKVLYIHTKIQIRHYIINRLTHYPHFTISIIYNILCADGKLIWSS